LGSTPAISAPPAPGGDGRLIIRFRRFKRAALLRGGPAVFQILEAELVVLLELPDLLLHLQELEAHFLDTPIEGADLFLELTDPRNIG
jgi:hypothetical protein